MVFSEVNSITRPEEEFDIGAQSDASDDSEDNESDVAWNEETDDDSED